MVGWSRQKNFPLGRTNTITERTTGTPAKFGSPVESSEGFVWGWGARRGVTRKGKLRGTRRSDPYIPDLHGRPGWLGSGSDTWPLWSDTLCPRSHPFPHPPTTAVVTPHVGVGTGTRRGSGRTPRRSDVPRTWVPPPTTKSTDQPRSRGRPRLRKTSIWDVGTGVTRSCSRHWQSFVEKRYLQNSPGNRPQGAHCRPSGEPRDPLRLSHRGIKPGELLANFCPVSAPGSSPFRSSLPRQETPTTGLPLHRRR